MPRRGRNAWLRLDEVDTRDAELPGEIDPFLVVADHLLPPERHRLFEPTAESRAQRRALVFVGPEELEQFPLPVEIEQRRAPQQLHQLLAVERSKEAIFEVLFPRGKIRGVCGIDTLQAGEDVARYDHGVDRISPDVRVAEDVNVALGPGVAGRDVE